MNRITRWGFVVVLVLGWAAPAHAAVLDPGALTAAGVGDVTAGAAARRLRTRGKLVLTVTVAFTPAGGTTLSAHKRITLRHRRRR